MKLHWPTSLAVSPLDGALYFVDNFVVFKLSQQLQVSIVAGMPSFCQEELQTSGSSTQHSEGQQNHQNLPHCTSSHLDARHFGACGEDILFGSITFTPSGVLYASDISRQTENRVYALASGGGGTLIHVAGFRSNGYVSGGGSSSSLPNCSVERCSDIGGHNCTCLITANTDAASSPSSKDTEYTTPLVSIITHLPSSG